MRARKRAAQTPDITRRDRRAAGARAWERFAPSTAAVGHRCTVLMLQPIAHGSSRLDMSRRCIGAFSARWAWFMASRDRRQALVVTFQTDRVDRFQHLVPRERAAGMASGSARRRRARLWWRPGGRRQIGNRPRFRRRRPRRSRRSARRRAWSGCCACRGGWSRRRRGFHSTSRRGLSSALARDACDSAPRSSASARGRARRRRLTAPRRSRGWRAGSVRKRGRWRA